MEKLNNKLVATHFYSSKETQPKKQNMRKMQRIANIKKGKKEKKKMKNNDLPAGPLRFWVRWAGATPTTAASAPRAPPAAICGNKRTVVGVTTRLPPVSGRICLVVDVFV